MVAMVCPWASRASAGPGLPAEVRAMWKLGLPWRLIIELVNQLGDKSQVLGKMTDERLGRC